METQNVNVTSFTRNVKWDFFFDFQTPCNILHTSFNKKQESAKLWLNINDCFAIMTRKIWLRKSLNQFYNFKKKKGLKIAKSERCYKKVIILQWQSYKICPMSHLHAKYSLWADCFTFMTRKIWLRKSLNHFYNFNKWFGKHPSQ